MDSVATRPRQNSHSEEADDDVLLMNATDFESGVLAEAHKKAILLDRIKRTPRRPSKTTDETEFSDSIDVRNQLFGQIPEPYLHVTTFQRVSISESGDLIDKDTLDACNKLKKCVDLREKWLNAHPFPPQDIASGFTTDELVKASIAKAVSATSPRGVMPSRSLSLQGCEGGGGDPPFSPLTPDSPVVSREGSVGTAARHPDDYRRRLVPRYDIFSEELPTALTSEVEVPTHILELQLGSGTKQQELTVADVNLLLEEKSTSVKRNQRTFNPGTQHTSCLTLAGISEVDTDAENSVSESSGEQQHGSRQHGKNNHNNSSSSTMNVAATDGTAAGAVGGDGIEGSDDVTRLEVDTSSDPNRKYYSGRRGGGGGGAPVGLARGGDKEGVDERNKGAAEAATTTTVTCELKFKLVNGVMVVYLEPRSGSLSSPDVLSRSAAGGGEGEEDGVSVKPPPAPQSTTTSKNKKVTGAAATASAASGKNHRPSRSAMFDPTNSAKSQLSDNSNDSDGGADGSGGDVVPRERCIKNLFPVLPLDDFIRDYNFIRHTIYSGPVTSYCFTRLELLSANFNLHVLLNGTRELNAQKSVPHRDFYNVRKVDTHVHHSACMNQKHLLRFIKHKLRYVPNDVVIFRDDKHLTLGEVFKSLNLTAYDLSIDTLDMHAHDTFHRFDRFNLKYNPAGQSRLREIFLKTDNMIGGRYLAELTKEVMGDLEASKYQLAEWRVSIYGRKTNEWEKLASWFFDNKLAHGNIRWLIQVPRLYHIYRESGEVKSFAEMLSNIFDPLFAVSVDPSSCPQLHYFLETVVAFDSVDDESRPERTNLSAAGPGGANVPLPEAWTSVENPPYAYWMYYTYANICVLNQLRAARGLRTFQFRPHCGEAGDVDHLVSTYLVADQINHGILLRKNPGIQYLYYLSQVGIAMSPLSNNKLFLDYSKNPFPRYFSQGMNVSLSTDDPLMLHYTKDALVEEYSVATQVLKLSAADQCEIARNSVLQSGWERKYKLYFLGENFSDIRETNVPEIRLQYRKEVLEAEKRLLDTNSSSGATGTNTTTAANGNTSAVGATAAAGSPGIGGTGAGAGGGIGGLTTSASSSSGGPGVFLSVHSSSSSNSVGVGRNAVATNQSAAVCSLCNCQCPCHATAALQS